MRVRACSDGGHATGSFRSRPSGPLDGRHLQRHDRVDTPAHDAADPPGSVETRSARTAKSSSGMPPSTLGWDGTILAATGDSHGRAERVACGQKRQDHAVPIRGDARRLASSRVVVPVVAGVRVPSAISAFGHNGRRCPTVAQCKSPASSRSSWPGSTHSPRSAGFWPTSTQRVTRCSGSVSSGVEPADPAQPLLRRNLPLALRRAGLDRRSSRWPAPVLDDRHSARLGGADRDELRSRAPARTVGVEMRHTRHGFWLHDAGPVAPTRRSRATRRPTS